MKVKEIERTANIAWSPAIQHPTYIAAGTAAQQLDATFSTNAALEIFTLNLSEAGLKTNVVGSIPSEFRFHKLAWSEHGMDTHDLPSGVLVGGTDNGNIYMWNPAKIVSGEDALLYHTNKHTGPVTALDFNPFQGNLLASGACDSDIYIWDINNPTNPMTPGAKSQPPDDVACIAWNRQVQHILASTFASRVVVWDLRKNEPIIKISDSMSRIKCKLTAWHPDVATQMCIASEDDHTPVIQLWDLRFATSPLKVLENHQRGILSMAWCPQDPDLLLSCGKDNRILCWNPNSAVQSGEVVYELPTSHQWSYDVKWCPRNPAIISSCAFDGHISIYSLMGGDSNGPDPIQTPKQVDAFSNDPFSQVQQPQQVQGKMMPLKKPPKWLRRPVGACFGFGGKLVSFSSEKPTQQGQVVPKYVNISQVVTEIDLLQRSSQLETAMTSGQFLEFCNLKLANCKDVSEESIWSFLKGNFEKEPRKCFLKQLGYDPTDLNKKVSEATGNMLGAGEGVDASELAEKMSLLKTLNVDGKDNKFASGQSTPRSPGRSTPGEGAAAFDQIAAQKSDSRSESPFPITTDSDIDGLINQAVLIGNFDAAVELCLHDERWAEAIILAIAGGPELLARTQKKYFTKNRDSSSRLISSVVTGNWSHVIQTCDLDNWKEALAVALTYAQANDFTQLCDMLGSRLEIERNGALSINAALCYICSGNVEKLVQCWARHNDANDSPESLQNLVEKVMVLRKAVEVTYGQAPEITSGMLPQKLSRYAGILAAQGCLTTAYNYLGNTNEQSLLYLRDRLYKALGSVAASLPAPPCPYQPIRIAKSPQPPAVQNSQMYGQNQYKQNSYQSTARGNVSTSSTSSGYGTNQYSTHNGVSPTQSSFSQPNIYSPPAPSPGASTASPTVPSSYNRGSLGHKYGNPPSNPYTSQSYSQPNFFTPDPNVSQYSQAQYDQYQNTGYNPQAQFNPNPTPMPDVYNPYQNQPDSYAGAPYSPPQPQPQSNMPSVPSFQENRPEEPWNDPPAVTEKKKVAPQMFDSSANQQLFNPAMSAADQPPTGQNPSYNQFYNPADYQRQVQEQVTQPPQHQQQQHLKHQQINTREPPAPVPKEPIPEENIILQEIFDLLVNKCLSVAPNPPTKRKLEDVTRKLESLYDRLRKQQLSQNTLLGLHQIIQAIQQYNYESGLQVHTSMVSQGNFSEISHFMPGIKVLLQTAHHLNVYV